MRPGKKEEEEEEEEAGERKKVKRDSAASSSASSDGRKKGMGSGYEPISSLSLPLCLSVGRQENVAWAEGAAAASFLLMSVSRYSLSFFPSL